MEANGADQSWDDGDALSYNRRRRLALRSAGKGSGPAYEALLQSFTILTSTRSQEARVLASPASSSDIFPAAESEEESELALVPPLPGQNPRDPQSS